MTESINSELVDLVDSQGIVQLVGVPRQDVEIHPNLHMQIVIVVITDKEGRILVHQRSLDKKNSPGQIDLVCGGVLSGESPENAAKRESEEETGIIPTQVSVVMKGVNAYNRYRYLLSGRSDDQPSDKTPEAEWIKWLSREELTAKRDNSEFEFVHEFFEDIQSAVGL